MYEPCLKHGNRVEGMTGASRQCNEVASLLSIDWNLHDQNDFLRESCQCRPMHTSGAKSLASDDCEDSEEDSTA